MHDILGMTDKADEPSSFSFRMFDLYRRFVEVLQLNGDYLKSFKTGKPQEEICRRVIKKIFEFRQSEEKTLRMVEYLRKNAKLIASHAEKTPHNWAQALDYTETCIKMIRRYLKQKNIDIKKELQSVKELAEEIGVLLYEKPNERQLEPIVEYLKHDLRNPKNTILSSECRKSKYRAKKSKGSESTSKSTEKTKETSHKDAKVATHSTEVNKNSLKMVIKKLPKDALQTGGTTEKIDSETLQKLYDQKFYDGIKAEQELQSQAGKQNVSLEMKDSKEDLRRQEDCQEENSVELLDDSQSANLEDNVDKSDNPSCKESSDYGSALKRKSCNSDEDYTTDCVKKLMFSNDKQNPDEDQYVTISYYDNNNRNCETIVIVPDTTGNETIQIDDSTDSEINVEDDRSVLKTKCQILNNSQEAKHQVSSTESVKEEEVFEEQTLDPEEHYCIENDSKYTGVVHLTYTDVLQMMDSVMLFCELKNEVTLEEFLVLRRTRDKMEWRSLRKL